VSLASASRRSIMSQAFHQLYYHFVFGLPDVRVAAIHVSKKNLTILISSINFGPLTT